MTRHGGQILADQLAIQGVRAAFTVPGESFLAALDGLHDKGGIQTIICRQEGGAAMMAEGRILDQPGLLVNVPTLLDPTMAPDGRHVLSL